MARPDYKPAGQTQQADSRAPKGLFVNENLPPASGGPPNDPPRYRNKYGGCACFEFFVEAKEQKCFRLGIHFAFGEHKMIINRPNPVFKFVREQWLLKFGVNGGDLEFNLDNLRAPLSSRKFVGEFPKEVKVKRSREKSISDSKQRDGSISANATPLAASAQMRLLRKFDASGSDKEEFEECVYTIHTTGDETSPKWTFRGKSDEGFLTGGLIGAALATLQTSAVPVALSGSFNIMQSDIRVTVVDGVEDQYLNDWKKADLRLRLRKFVFQKTGSSLSDVRWTYGHASCR